jgi:hypothetical protein
LSWLGLLVWSLSGNCASPNCKSCFAYLLFIMLKIQISWSLTINTSTHFESFEGRGSDTSDQGHNVEYKICIYFKKASIFDN